MGQSIPHSYGLGAQWFQFDRNSCNKGCPLFQILNFVVGPGCAVKNLEGCFFGFGWKAVHSYDVVGIVVFVCCWVDDSVFSSDEIGQGLLESEVFNCPDCNDD